jgi:hypothetical protein
MAQSNIETRTKRARTLASQTSDQRSKAFKAMRPGRTSRRASRGRFSELVAMAQGFPSGAQWMRRMPVSSRFAWRAGRLTGRIQGASAVAPFAARGWRLALTSRLQLQATRAQALVRWLPAVVAGARLATPSAAKDTKQVEKAARMRAREAARVAQRAQATAAKQATAQAARIDRTRGKMARPSKPPRVKGGTRRPWSLTRSFVIGFSIGAVWAYLFAQRVGPGYQALQQNLRATRAA